MKLNLHLHTEYSDGADSVEEMAVWIKGQGHCCLVTSDHDYCMTPEKYEQQLLESAEVSARIGFPIINALEISLWFEEAVLVGTEACRRWLAERAKSENHDQRGFDLVNTTWKRMPGLLDGFDYGLCLVHPGLRQEQLDYSMFHAYEIMNSGHGWGEGAIAKMKEMMPNAKPVRGMDAHSANSIHMVELYRDSCNEITHPITNERELIDWVRSSI